MVKKYSIAQLGKGHKLSEHFTLGEFACHDGTDKVMVHDRLLELLEQIRAWARDIMPDSVVIINSGYRTESYNAKVGGAKNSQHLYGTAADIRVAYGPKGKQKFVEPATIYKAIEAGKVTGSSFVGGLGLYTRPQVAKAWLHVDCRFNNARWTG
jgi:uncharacterized protein YcbK (DUF882 family)